MQRALSLMYTFHGSLAERESYALPSREGDEDEECFSMLCGVDPKPPAVLKQSNDEWYANSIYRGQSRAIC